MPSRSARSMAARIIRCELKGVEELNKIQEPSDPGITMRAIVQDAYGSADVLHQAEVEKPAIAANEGLVKGHAAGVDRGTWHLMAGQPYLMRIIGFGLRRPKKRYDLVLDIGGHSRLSRVRRGLTPTGTLVIAGGEGAKWTGGGRHLRALTLSAFVRQRLTMFVSKHCQADLETLSRLIETGQIAPIVDRTYPLAEVPHALRRIEAGQARGKIAITI